ncbi:MAG: (2Fe-2S)-binding protein [Acidobacteria bacterium]|nr:(2Fe-2S)-binding protein [Acidobacteriota bacterium]
MAETKRLRISFLLNGKETWLEIEPNLMLVDLLRESLFLTGTKKSCAMGICGACTVVVDGMAVSSCTFPAFNINGREVLTIEGLSSNGQLHPLQKAFIQKGGFQCGFCTPGMILMAKTLLDENPAPTEEEIRTYMDGNICRCTGYQMIVESILEASRSEAGEIN